MMKREALKERIAALIYRAWSRWMSSLFSKGFFDVQGRWVMSKEACDEYTGRITKKYTQLNDYEKAWPRTIATQVLDLVWLLKENENDYKSTGN